MANRLLTMKKYLENSALATSLKKSKKAERLSAEETASKHIQLEAKRASKEGLKKAERDKRQKAYRENKQRE